jgi:hypothetical protein
MSRAIATLCLGEKYIELSRLTHPMMLDYAVRCRADFITFLDNRFLPGKPFYEKYRINDLLETYESVLFLDTDIVVTPHAPDIFDIVPPEAFGAYFVSEHTDHHDQAILDIQRDLGDIGWRHTYFNSGVMLARRVHRVLFDPALGTHHGPYPEQTQLNYNVHKLGVPTFDVTYKFNHTTAVKKSHERLSSYFIHYPGNGHVPGKRRGQQIRDDIRVLTRPTWLDKVRGTAKAR